MRFLNICSYLFSQVLAAGVTELYCEGIKKYFQSQSISRRCAASLGVAEAFEQVKEEAAITTNCVSPSLKINTSHCAQKAFGCLTTGNPAQKDVESGAKLKLP